MALGLHPSAAGLGQLQEHRHENGGQTAGSHPVLQQSAREVVEILREYRAILKTRANPESHPGHDPLAVVDAVLHHDPHADHKQHRQQHGDVGGCDRPRNRQQHRRRLGQKRHRNEHGAHRHADPAGSDPGELGHRYAARISGVRHGARQTGQQVPQSICSHRTLHGTEIDGLGPPVGDALDGDRVPDGFDGAHQGHEHERRKQGPEGGSEAQIQPRPSARGNSDPGRFGDEPGVVDSVEPGHHRSGYNADHRRP